MYYFVVNPTSSSGQGTGVWDRTQKALKERGISYEAFILSRPGEASEIAEKLSALEGHHRVILLGGDGTLNEFLNGLKDYSHLTLGYLPTGSGNDFARGMQLPRDPEKFLNMILDPRAFRMVTIARVTSGDKSCRFAVSSGAGFDAAVCYETATAPMKGLLNKLHLGKLIYTLYALKLIFGSSRFSADLTVDDGQVQHIDRALFAAAMNTPYEGGGFRFAPKADPTDDLLDVIYAEGMSVSRVLRVLPLARFGLHTHCKGVHMIRCSSFTIHSDTPLCVHTDGEHFGFCSDITYSLEKEKIKLITG